VVTRSGKNQEVSKKSDKPKVNKIKRGRAIRYDRFKFKSENSGKRIENGARGAEVHDTRTYTRFSHVRPCLRSGGHIVVARIRFQVKCCGIYGGEVAVGQIFSRISLFPVPVLIPPTAPYSSVLWGCGSNSGLRTKWTLSHPTPRN
jgi:hypothetical protein